MNFSLVVFFDGWNIFDVIILCLSDLPKKGRRKILPLLLVVILSSQQRGKFSSTNNKHILWGKESCFWSWKRSCCSSKREREKENPLNVSVLRRKSNSHLNINLKHDRELFSVVVAHLVACRRQQRRFWRVKPRECLHVGFFLSSPFYWSLLTSFCRSLHPSLPHTQDKLAITTSCVPQLIQHFSVQNIS